MVCQAIHTRTPTSIARVSVRPPALDSARWRVLRSSSLSPSAPQYISKSKFIERNRFESTALEVIYKTLTAEQGCPVVRLPLGFQSYSPQVCPLCSPPLRDDGPVRGVGPPWEGRQGAEAAVVSRGTAAPLSRTNRTAPHERCRRFIPETPSPHLMYPPRRPCNSYGKVPSQYGPYAYCSLDKGVACTYHIHGELVQEGGM